ncbi:MAG: hypothetical protein KJ558_15475 [Gammaproteobacteria bacterium]|nr:hypothetical protein [Gammaproteobacteria bacterium]MBU1656188.1 hypothetical protein [Gammaproteobacteria bacterium]MBU1960448.1 hypothetical protein [Gammaproteobacteria bacterium]
MKNPIVRTLSLTALLLLAAQGQTLAGEAPKPAAPAPQPQETAPAKAECAPLPESGPARESQLMEMITQGAREFLLPQKDGYLWPVVVKDPAFMESLPVKVWVTPLNGGKAIAAQVVKLQLREAGAGLAAEVASADGAAWTTVQDGHWHNGRFLARAGDEPVWHAYDAKLVRFKAK